MATCPNTTSDLGLVRHIISLSAIIFHPVLNTQNQPESAYLIVDTHSAAFLAQRLSRIAGIRCERLNTLTPASERLRAAVHLRTGIQISQEYPESGLYDVMFHLARAMIAASRRSFASCKSTGAKISSHSTTQHPETVYTRAIASLAHAFGQTSEIIRDVLGPIESCYDDVLLHSEWFPDMQWIRHCTPCHGVEMWPSTRNSRERLEHQLDVLSNSPASPPHSQQYPPRTHLPSRRSPISEGSCGSSTMTLDGGMDEHLDEDAEGETDPEYTPRQANISGGVAGPRSSSRGKQPVRRISKRRRSECDSLSDSTDVDVSRSPIVDTRSSKRARR